MPATAPRPTTEVIDILDYSTNVVNYYSHRPPENTMLLGLEWEMLGHPSMDHLRLALGAARLQSPTFIAKRDGSVSRGLELVTLPQTMEQHNTMLDLLDTSTILSNSSCGVHVHLTRAMLSDGQLTRMYNMIHSSARPMQTLINKVARRGQNMYCARTGRRVDDINSVYTNHYNAIGVSDRHPTVELRIFASTNKIKYIKSYLQFTLALADYCGASGNIDDPREFIGFVAERAELYPELNVRFQTAPPFAEYRTPLVEETPTEGTAASRRADAPVGHRRLPASGFRERRTQSHVPSTEEVRNWLGERMIRNGFHGATTVTEYARQLRSRTRSAATNEFCRWYANQCWFDNPVNGRENRTIITATGNRVEGSDEIRSHALYHLRLIGNAEEALAAPIPTLPPYTPIGEPDQQAGLVSPIVEEHYRAYENGEVNTTATNRRLEQGGSLPSLEIDIAQAAELVLNSMPNHTT